MGNIFSIFSPLYISTTFFPTKFLPVLVYSKELGIMLLLVLQLILGEFIQRFYCREIFSCLFQKTVSKAKHLMPAILILITLRVVRSEGLPTLQTSTRNMVYLKLPSQKAELYASF
ncbi:unnamed protein product [Larinioides sclopetarius]|uniref:Uncharacterized protein n=1 Tax=Larinioides sclopetarius TaxID=280406 RepID=A0AAV1Z0Y3_9ARAC